MSAPPSQCSAPSPPAPANTAPPPARRGGWRRALRAASVAAAAGCALGAAVFAASWALLPPPLDREDSFPAGIVLRDREGGVLRVTLGPGDVDCRPTYVPAPGDWITKALVASEDKRFYDHRGADLLSLARAIRQNLFSGRRVSGASTLSQQTVRLIEPHPRSLRWKYVEFFQALRLERVRSKEWILAQYLNRAPFGSNYIGIEAAAHGWFDKDPHELSLGEAALLAGLVQAPSRLRPDRHPERALRRRDYVLGRMRELGMATEEQLAAAAAPPALRRGRRPFRHPHYCDWALQELVREGERDVATPLDPRAQELLERAVDARAAALGCDCAAVLADPATGEIRALACSGDYFGAPAGQFNVATAPRPAGSTLKPLLFARALDRGLLAPTEALPDVPRRYGTMRPADFESHFRGVVRADDALVLSLNLPFFEVVRRLGVADALATLRAAGLGTVPDDPAAQGLGIAVGNAPVRLVDLARAYAGLARAAGAPAAPPGADPLLPSPGAARIVTDILSGQERSFDALGHLADARLPRAAWKTGTSAAHRDAWTVLWTPGEVVAVWCGHRAWRFGDRTIVGARAAAPLAWEIFRALRPSGEAPWYEGAAPGVETRSVCDLSGLPPSPDCPSVRDAPALAGRTPRRPCAVHRRGADGAVRAVWPPEIEAFLRRTPSGLRVGFPADGATLRLPGEQPWSLSCSADRAGSATNLWWSLDGVPAGDRPAREPFLAEGLSPGPHEVSCADGEGNAATARFLLAR